jgi:hypothetical protein
MIALYENLRKKLIEVIQKHMETNSKLAVDNVELIMKNQELIDQWIKSFKIYDEDLPDINEENIHMFEVNEGKFVAWVTLR